MVTASFTVCQSQLELIRHFFHRATGPDLDRRPLGRPRGEQAVLGGDPVVAEHPALAGALLVHARHAVLLPEELHRRAVDGEVDVGDDRALFHSGAVATARTSNVLHHPLDMELHVARATLVGEDPHVLQPDEGLHDFGRVVKDEGVSIFLDHT